MTSSCASFSKDKTILVASDLHETWAHQQAAKNLVQFITEHRPTKIVCCLTPSADEAPDMVAAMINGLRNVHNGTITLQYATLAPPLQASDPSDKIEQVSGLYEVAPGWVSTVASPTSSNDYPGASAIGLARRIKQSVVWGGASHLAHISETSVQGEERVSMSGIEIGSLATSRRPVGSAWGFALLEVGSATVSTLVRVRADGSFAIGDEIYA